MVDASPLDEDTGSPGGRALLALGVLALLRWSIYGPVSTATTAEVLAQETLRRYVDATQAAMRDQDYAQALSALTELSRIQPRNHVYVWQRAAVLGTLHRPREEIDALEQFVKVSPLPGEACPRLPFLYRELGMKTEALDAFARCAAYSPNDLQDAFYYGHALEMDGQVDRALQVYRDALKNGTNGDDEAGLGRMLLRKGKPEAAYQAVEPTLTRNPRNVDALLVAGIALSRLGKYDAATELLERGAAYKDNTDFEYALGLIAEIHGRTREAVAHYDEALRLDPDNRDATRRRARLVPAR